MIKKICFVLNGGFPVPAIRGGAIEQLVEILLRENEDKHFFDFTVVGPYDKELAENHKRWRHTIFVDFEIPQWKRQVSGTLRALIKKFTKRDFVTISAYERKVKRWLMRNGGEFDYIINEHADDGLFVKPARKYGRGKFINHLHMETFADRNIISAFQNYLSVSKYVEETFRKSVHETNLNCNYLVFYNAVDLSRYQQKKLTKNEKLVLRHKLGFADTDFVILFCGRIKPFKGVKEIMQAVVSIDNPHVKLLVIGASNFQKKSKSPYEDAVSKLVSENADRIKNIGYVDNCNLYQYRQIVDIGCVPSTCEESFSMVLLEFMASGLPTIATVSGGMVEVGSDETTLFVEKQKNLVENLRDAILKLYNDPQLRYKMSEASINRSRLFDSRDYLENFKTSLEGLSN